MLIVLLALTNLGQALTEIVNFTRDAIWRRTPLRDIPCARMAPCPVLLSSTIQVGQHEKNANQCNSARRVAHGDGRWPAPIRPQHRSTG